MRLFLIHIRDPQFFSVPAQATGRNGRVQVLGFPPIGIMSLASVLAREGHEPVLFDQANPETPDARIIEEIRRQEPALVGLSFLSTTSYSYAKQLARKIRAAVPSVKMALGGVFASLNAALVKMQCPEVDFVARGEGEQLILDLMEHLEEPEAVASLTFVRDGEIVENPGAPLVRDLDRWPFPDRDSLPIDYIESMPLDVPAILSKRRYTTMQTSRGCPWNCTFCDIPAFSQGKWRFRSAEHVLAEFEQLREKGYEAVYFIDDHFLLKPSRIEEICRGLIDRRIDIRWGCEGRVDSTGRHLFPLMAKAKCQLLMFGIESGSQKVLDRLHKDQSLADIESAVTGAKEAGIGLVHGFFVVGSPDETVEDMRATFDFASRLRLDTFAFNRLCTYRGTPLWQEYLDRGYVDDERDWYKYFKCSSIDPTCLDGEVIHAERAAGMRRLILYKFLHYPIQTAMTLARFFRYMRARDVLFLLVKPFLGKKSGATEAEVLSRTV